MYRYQNRLRCLLDFIRIGLRSKIWEGFYSFLHPFSLFEKWFPARVKIHAGGWIFWANTVEKQCCGSGSAWIRSFWETSSGSASTSKTGSRSEHSPNLGAVEAQNGAMMVQPGAVIPNSIAVKAQNGVRRSQMEALRLTIGLWRVCWPVVADSHHLMRSQIRIRIKVESRIRIRI